MERLPVKSSNIAASERWRLKKKVLGLCQQCGQHPAREGKINCVKCADKHSAKSRKGTKCKVCGCGLNNKKRLCAEHSRTEPKQAKDRRDRLKKAGLCIQCGENPTLPNSVRCEGCALKLRIDGNNSYRKLRLKVISLYGGKCVCCGETELDFLTMDHKNNDGFIQRKKTKAGSATYKMILKERPNDVQVLCYNCNCAKGHYGICPHEVARGKIRPEKRVKYGELNTCQIQ